MNHKLIKSQTPSLELVIYTVAFVLVSMLVYTMNDETQPIIGILRIEYLIPCLFYSCIIILISVSFFGIFKAVVRKGAALGMALFLGIPIGIYSVFHFTNWLFK